MSVIFVCDRRENNPATGAGVGVGRDRVTLPIDK